MYKIIISDYFKKQLKKLVKKNRTLKGVLRESLINFQKESAISIGMGVYKIRLKGESKGKSGGYRAYLFIMEIENILTPICIYAKNEKENVTHRDVSIHLENTKDELRKKLQ